jgi:hypothetical protein
LRLNPDKVRAKNAYRTAKSLLEKTAKIKGSGTQEVFFRGIGEGLRGYIADKMAISPTGLVLEDVKDKLSERELSDKTITDLYQTIAECDMGRFAPLSPNESERANLVLKAKDLLTRLEAEWRG